MSRGILMFWVAMGFLLVSSLFGARAMMASADGWGDPASLDVDALAARMTTKQDIYQQMRDEALAAYTKANPISHPYDESVKKMLKLTAYLWVWGDLYREGLWRIVRQQAEAAKDAGATDPAVAFMIDIGDDHNLDDARIVSMNRRADIFAGTAYPILFKQLYYLNAISSVSHLKIELNSQDSLSASLAEVPEMVKKWGQFYEASLKQPLPNPVLFIVGSAFQEAVNDDDFTLNLVHHEIDRAFSEVAPDNPVQAALDGEYLTDEAWLARGSGWASTVTDGMSQRFADFLSQADQVLETAYAKDPDEGEISQLMLKVELGQGQGRDRMEQWFQRAIKANPNDTDAYAAKLYYLQPRWYGSEGDLVAFAQQCLATQNWEAGIPMTGTTAISVQSELDPNIYKQPEVWSLVEKVYRQFLDHYPNSIFYRTQLAHHASQAGQWDVAKQQFDLMGDHWDRSVMKDEEYTAEVTQANDLGHPIPKSISSPSSTASQSESFLSWAWRMMGL